MVWESNSIKSHRLIDVYDQRSQRQSNGRAAINLSNVKKIKQRTGIKEEKEWR